MATTKITPAPLTRTLAEIAQEIENDYRDKGKPVYFAAKPYVDAMMYMHRADLTGGFGDDDAEDIVIRLLGNLSTWRGDTATRVRNELKAGLAYYQQGKSQARHPAGQRRP